MVLYIVLLSLVASQPIKRKVKIGTKCHRVVDRSHIFVMEANSKDCSKKHVVEAGQEILGIARLYGTTTEKIQSLNPGMNLNSLSVGTPIVVPIDCPSLPESDLYMDNVNFQNAMFAVNGSQMLTICHMGGNMAASYCESGFNQLLKNKKVDSYGNILDWAYVADYFGMKKLKNSEKNLASFEMRVEGYNINNKMHYIVKSWKGTTFDPGRNVYNGQTNPVFKAVFDTWP